MKIIIKRIDKNIPLPEYKTKGAVAFDLSSREEVIIPSLAVGYIPLNIIVKVPAGFSLKIFARSGLHKKGLLLANSVGVIDTDYCGEEDEIKAACYNFTSSPIIVEKGERIVQGIFEKHELVEWEEIDKMTNLSRGGFNSTGAF
ncbi:MAG: dUTP diphosphatase [Candidatus Pacebacteria bacterium]|nr:dUTP diphosphatase [Candidatus Paceibacterota bacterium]